MGMDQGEISRWITLYHPQNEMSSGGGGKDRQTVGWIDLPPRYSSTAKLPAEFILPLKTRIKLATDLFLNTRSLKLSGSKRKRTAGRNFKIVVPAGIVRPPTPSPHYCWPVLLPSSSSRLHPDSTRILNLTISLDIPALHNEKEMATTMMRIRLRTATLLAPLASSLASA